MTCDLIHTKLNYLSYIYYLHFRYNRAFYGELIKLSDKTNLDSKVCCIIENFSIKNKDILNWTCG
jgi:hypothetical protein